VLSPERLARIRRAMVENPPPPLPPNVLDRIATMLKFSTTTAAGRRPERTTHRRTPQPSNPADVEVTRSRGTGDPAS
jgi:hypothetical protein